jgi:hypothetical protein
MYLLFSILDRAMWPRAAEEREAPKIPERISLVKLAPSIIGGKSS